MAVQAVCTQTTEHTQQVMDGKDFPEMFKPLASNMGKALNELRNRNDIKWTYISPRRFPGRWSKNRKLYARRRKIFVNQKEKALSVMLTMQ